MNPLSRSLRGRGPVLGGLVIVVLILDPGGLLRSAAREPATSANGAIREDEPSSAPSPWARLRVQRLKTRHARAAYESARLTREVAELAVTEYVEGSNARDLAAIELEIKLLEADLTRAQDRLEWVQRMFDKGLLLLQSKVAEELDYQKAQYALDRARSKKKVLAEYIRAKTLKALQVDVDRARKDEATRKAAWKREEARQAELERLLDWI